MSAKCRCYICGRKDADNNHIRNAYIRMGLQRDESGRHSKSGSKKLSRKLLRTREKRQWKFEW
jgi:hypothetical protein